MTRRDEPFLDYVGTWMLEMLGGIRRATVFYAFTVGVSLLAAITAAAEGDIGGAVVCVGIGCFFASNFVVCLRRTRRK
jgi:hypothetical protein